MRKFSVVLFAVAITVGTTLFLKTFGSPKPAESASLSSVSVSGCSLYVHDIEPIFSHRCAACHSCNTAPCQLNFTSYDGVIRGASLVPFNQPFKQSAVQPTRLGIDAQSEAGWRKMGFFSIVESAAPDHNVRQSNLYEALALKTANPFAPVTIQAERLKICPTKPAEWEKFAKAHAEAGMPYGLPALLPQELQSIEDWLKKGAPGPKAEELRVLKTVTNPAGRDLILKFEDFLNDPSIKSQIVARYLYEHLSLAHLHFKNEMPSEFYLIVRSRNTCAAGLDEIATRRPYDDPGVSKFSYCFKKVDQIITEKNHMVYEMSATRLQRWQTVFFAKAWRASVVPSYNPDTSANPLETFKELPAESRYQWLLDDAQYTVMTFIKGAVCRGHTAVNVVDEQFQIFFLNPKSDHFVKNAEYAAQAAPLLRLPGKYGSNVKFIKPSSQMVPFIMSNLKSKRNKYRFLRDEEVEKDLPGGYSLNDIWDGDGSNPNAVLTVYRHFDSAQVLKGAWGPMPKTAWVLDYPLMERIVYDLVVGYDVFGSMGHQVITRVYMHFIRMEAEENFLSFLPPATREPLRSYWYRDAPDVNKRYPLHPDDRGLLPTAMTYSAAAKTATGGNMAKAEFFNQIYKKRMTPQVLGTPDLINVTPLTGEISPSITSAHEFEQELRKIVSRPASELPFSGYLDDAALVHLIVDGSNHNDKVYTFIRNKEHFNIASILGERGRRDPANDSLNVVPGFAASYPNRFFSVDLKNASAFLRSLKAVRQQADIRDLIARYGISRQDPNFWKHYDWFLKYFAATNPTEAGVIDLVRYGNAEPLPEDDENRED